MVWCPSHLLDKNPPADAKIKYEKAQQQPGWKDSYMKLNLEADAIATTALKGGSGLHGVIASRETAMGKAQAVNAEIGIAVAKRLLSARLPQVATDMANPTLADLWGNRPAAEAPSR